jgi:RNA polymerase sigma-B factor
MARDRGRKKATQKKHEELPAWHDVDELFMRYKETKDPALREQLILKHSDLVHSLAKRFSGKGEPYEDLVQVAWYGLIKAIDRYNPTLGSKFTSFAVPTILGELKRHFRDRGWDVRVPRRLQELNQKVRHLIEELSNKLGRPPTIKELSQELGVSEETVIEALELARYYDLKSLDERANPAPDEEQEKHPPYESAIADELIEYERLMLRHEIEQAMKLLDERERKIVELTFYHGLPQTEIAKQLGISQMHVSRLLRRALEKLKKLLTE